MSNCYSRICTECMDRGLICVYCYMHLFVSCIHCMFVYTCLTEEERDRTLPAKGTTTCCINGFLGYILFVNYILLF